MCAAGPTCCAFDRARARGKRATIAIRSHHGGRAAMKRRCRDWAPWRHRLKSWSVRNPRQVIMAMLAKISKRVMDYRQTGCGPSGSRSARASIILRNAASALLTSVAALWLLVAHGAMTAETRNVLVLYSNNRLVAGNVAVDRGLRAAPLSSPDRSATLHNCRSNVRRCPMRRSAWQRTFAVWRRCVVLASWSASPSVGSGRGSPLRPPPT
jgi:hypothetical protein